MLNMLIPVPVLDMTSSDPVTIPGMLRSHLHAHARHSSDTSAKQRARTHTCVTRRRWCRECMHAREYGGARVTLGRTCRWRPTVI